MCLGWGSLYTHSRVIVRLIARMHHCPAGSSSIHGRSWVAVASNLCSGQPTGDILGFYFSLPSSTISEKWNEMGFVAFCCLHFSWTWLAIVPHIVRPFLPHSFFSSGDHTNWCPICLGHPQFMCLVLGWLFIPSPFTFKSDPVWTWIIQSPCLQRGMVLENGAVPR